MVSQGKTHAYVNIWHLFLPPANVFSQLVYVLLNIAGSDQRQEDLFSAEALFAKGRSALKGLKGVENVYMQHTPHLSQTLENLFKGRLRDTTHPFLDGAGPNAGLQRYASMPRALLRGF